MSGFSSTLANYHTMKKKFGKFTRDTNLADSILANARVILHTCCILS